MMSSYTFLFICFCVTNGLWAAFTSYLNSSWKDSYEDMVDEFMDVLDKIIEKEKEEFEPKGDEMR